LEFGDSISKYILFCCYFLNKPVQFALLFSCPHFESRSTDRHYDSRCLCSATALTNSSHGCRVRAQRLFAPACCCIPFRPFGLQLAESEVRRDVGVFTVGGESCGRWPSIVLLFVKSLQLQSSALSSACVICVF
jgi:hypothetical protein